MGCAAPSSFVVTLPLKAFSGYRFSGAPGSTVFAISWFASKPGRNQKTQSVVIRLQVWESRSDFPPVAFVPGVICKPSGCYCLRREWRPISLSFAEHGPGDARHLVG